MKFDALTLSTDLFGTGDCRCDWPRISVTVCSGSVDPVGERDDCLQSFDPKEKPGGGRLTVTVKGARSASIYKHDTRKFLPIITVQQGSFCMTNINLKNSG